MPKLELTGPEAEFLRELAEEWLSVHRGEIAHTDRRDHREALKRKEALLDGILERLGAPVTVPSRS